MFLSDCKNSILLGYYILKYLSRRKNVVNMITTISFDVIQQCMGRLVSAFGGEVPSKTTVQVAGSNN